MLAALAGGLVVFVVVLGVGMFGYVCYLTAGSEKENDHQTAHEHSKQALEHATIAHKRSEEALRKAANTAV